MDSENSIQIGEKITFSTDSPLFAKRVNHYGNDLDKLGEFLKLMVKQMRQFCKDIEIGSKSASELGNAMRAGMNASESHPTLIPIVKQFGDICTEIAAAQVILAESLDKCFVQPLETFYTNDVAKVQAMKQHYHNQREGYDTTIQKYLQSDTANFGRGTNQNQLDLRAFEVVQQKRRVEITRFDLVKKVNEVEAKKSFELAECCVSAIFSMRTHYHQCADIILSSKSILDELSRKQQKERKMYESIQEQQRKDGGDEKKIEMINILDSIISRVKSHSSYLQLDVVPSEPLLSAESRRNDEHTQSQPQFIQQSQTTSGRKSPVPGLASISQSQNSTTPSSNTTGSGSGTEQKSSLTRLSRIGAMGANLIGGITGTSKTINSPGSHSSTSSHTASSDSSSPSSSSIISSLRGITGTGSAGELRSNRTATPSPPPPPPHDDVVTMVTCEERERRLRALDYSELTKLYNSNPEEEPEGVVFQGYLWKKSTLHKVRQHWNRRWFVLDGSKVFYIKENATGLGHDIHLVCDIMLGAVRELKSAELPFCFEIVYANVRATTLQAEGAHQYAAWIDAIRSAIGKRLVIGGPALRQVVCANNVSTKRDISATQKTVSSDPAERRRLAALAQEILAANPFCADCGKASPEWVSLNLGCLVCIECSGVHRSLGVHISKMRSLTLDDLEAEEYMLIRMIGNNNSNTIWDCVPYVDKDGTRVVKPAPTDPEQLRYAYIRSKYQHRVLLSTSLPRVVDDSSRESVTIESLRRALLAAIKKDDVIVALEVLAHGGMIGLYVNDDSSPLGPTENPLHVAAESGSLSCCTLLVLNGFDPVGRDERGRLAGDVAQTAGHAAVAAYLRRKADSLQIAPTRNVSARPYVEVNAKLPFATIINEILAANTYCADCGKPYPEFVSLNLGCVVCGECSVVHRNLGEQESKIRSLLTDSLELEEYEVVKNIGNDTSNAIWETVGYTDNDGTVLVKPNATDNDEMRVTYINAKYKDRLLLSPSLPRLRDDSPEVDPMTAEALSMILLAAVEADDAPGALKALAHGAGIIIYLMENSSQRRSGRHPLHVAAESGSLSCCTLLVLNGFDPVGRDERGRLAGDVAQTAGHAAVAAYLRRKAEQLQADADLVTSASSCESIATCDADD